MSTLTAVSIIKAHTQKNAAVRQSALAQYNRKLQLSGSTSVALSVALGYIFNMRGIVGHSYGC